MNKDNLHGWVFTYNSYDDYWYATTRDHYINLFNSPGVNTIRSKDFEMLKMAISSGNIQLGTVVKEGIIKHVEINAGNIKYYKDKEAIAIPKKRKAAHRAGG